MSWFSTVGGVTCRQEVEHGKQQQQREQRRSFPKRPTLNPNSKQAELLASVASDMNTFSNDGSFMDRFAALQAAGGADGQTGRPVPAEEEELSLSGVAVRLACYTRSLALSLCVTTCVQPAVASLSLPVALMLVMNNWYTCPYVFAAAYGNSTVLMQATYAGLASTISPFMRIIVERGPC